MHDVIVVGLGAMGSAALYHLAAAGARVAGIDAFEPPHDFGSTHGHSRIIREAYFEHPAYVPLVRRAYEQWAALERASGRSLFRRTGGLMIGAPGSGLVAGTLASAEQHDISVSTLDAAELSSRFPALRPAPNRVGVLEHNAGVLDPEACVSAYLALAQARGAECRLNTRVLELRDHGDAIEIVTNGGAMSARRIILAAPGAWTKALATSLGAELPLVVERQVMHWFSPGDNALAFDAAHLPITLIEHDAERYVYLIPDLGQGVKAAVHYEGAYVQPDDVDRVVSLRRMWSRCECCWTGFVAPPLAEHHLRSSVCLYTNTPDKHFLGGLTARARECIRDQRLLGSRVQVCERDW